MENNSEVEIITGYKIMALATPNLLVFTQVDVQTDKTHLLKQKSPL